MLLGHNWIETLVASGPRGATREVLERRARYGGRKGRRAEVRLRTGQYSVSVHAALMSLAAFIGSCWQPKPACRKSEVGAASTRQT